MAEDINARLELVQQAIDDLILGRASSVEVNGEKVTYHDLGELRAQERELRRRLAAKSGTSVARRYTSARFRRPS
jgi:hypothetical protein